MSNRTIKINPMWLLLLIIGVIYTLMSYWSPVQFDDWFFINMYRDANGGNNNFSFDAWFSFIGNERLIDNSRIANMIAPFTTLFSPWNAIFPFLSGLMMVLMIYFATKLTGKRPTDLFYPVIIWAAFIVFLPWRSYIFTDDYLLNYVYASAVTLAFVYVVAVRPQILEKKRILIGCIILAALAGGWHEGFSATTACGLAALFIVKRFRMPWQVWTVAIIFGIVCLVVTLSPGILNRFSNEADISSNQSIGLIKWLSVQIPTVVLALSMAFATIIPAGRRRLKTLFKSETFIILITTLTVATAIAMHSRYNLRTFFWPSELAVICLIMFYLPLTDAITSRRRISSVMTAVIALGCIAQSAYSLIWQHRVYNQDKVITALVEASDKNTVFYDYFCTRDIPKTTLYICTSDKWADSFTMKEMSRALGRETIAVVPTALRYPRTDARRLDGDGTYFSTKGKVWTTPSNFPDLSWRHIATAEVTHSDGTTNRTAASLTPFTAEDGERLIFVNLLKENGSDISAIRIVSYWRASSDREE